MMKTMKEREELGEETLVHPGLLVSSCHLIIISHASVELDMVDLGEEAWPTPIP